MAKAAKSARKKEEPPQVLLRELAAELERGLLCGYVLRGAERWFRDRALDLVRRAAAASGAEICQHDAGEGDFAPQALQDDLRGGALFASSRCVVISNPAEVLKKVEGRDSPVARSIRSFLEGRRGTVVLCGGGLRADDGTVKAIVAAGGRDLSFRSLYAGPSPWNPDPRKGELVGWIVARSRERGLALSPEQAVLLETAHGADLAALDSQIELLRHGRDGGFAELVAGDAPGSPYDLADSLLDGDLPASLSGIERLFRGGMVPKGEGLRVTAPGALLVILFGALRGKLRETLAASQEVEAGASPADAANRAGVPTWPKARQPFLARLGRRGPRDWRAMIEDLAELERRSRGAGAGVDQNDLVVLALRWRIRGRKR